MPTMPYRMVGFLLFSFCSITGCETQKTDISKQNQGTISTVGISVAALLAQANRALQANDFAGCASAFASVAAMTTGHQAANCWYHASRCAARAGDYATSSSYIQAAASAGYANLEELRSDALLRPLHSLPSWLWVEDFVIANRQKLDAEPEETAICRVGETSGNAPIL